MLKGKTAFITGTNRGIGKEILREFAKNGANVFAHARCESDDFLQMINNVASENNVTITPEVFYEKVNAGMKPSTSQPSVGRILEVYEKLKSEGYERIVAFSVSSKLSGNVC